MGALTRRRRRRASGFTFLELIIVVALLGILTAALLPVVKNASKRHKEAELEQALTRLRRAIDEHKRFTLGGMIAVDLAGPQDGYPEDLEALTEPIEVIPKPGKVVQFLRRIPVDPMTGEADWGVRTYQEDPDSTSSWGDGGVYDVYSLSEGVGLSGVPYREW